MRSFTPETTNVRELQDLGMASVQILHDLKNQLNGLKLYATFLRKRMETSDRPAEELEVIAKLIAGIERTAAELTTLVRYGRPIELRTRPGVAINQILFALKDREMPGEEIDVEIDDSSLVGEFDGLALTDAFKSITNQALSMRRNGSTLSITQRLDDETRPSQVVIEWCNIDTGDHDVFRSLSGADALRMALAAKVIEAHQGTAEQQAGILRVCLPIQGRDGD